jgi:hypothetical protein
VDDCNKVELHKHIDALLKAERDLDSTRWEFHRHEHELSHVAVGKAEDAMKIRLEGMNEIRKQLEDQAATFATRESIKPLQDFIEKANFVTRDQYDIVMAFMNKFQGTLQSFAFLNAAISTAAAIVAILVSKFLR